VDRGLGTVVLMDLVVDIADSLAVCDIRSNVTTDFGNSAHASTTSHELLESILELTLPAAVTNGSSDEFGIVGLGGEPGSLSETGMDGRLDTVVFVDLVVDIANGLAVGDIRSNVTTDFGDPAHASATSHKFLKSVFELTLLVAAAVTGNSGDELRIVGLVGDSCSLSETWVDVSLVDTEVLLDLVVGSVDDATVSHISSNITANLGDPAHTSTTSHEIFKLIFEIALPPAGVASGGSNDPGVVGLGVLASSLDETRVDGGLGTVVLVDFVVDITDGLAVGDVGSNISTDLGNSAHASATSDKLIDGILEIALPPAGVTSSGSNDPGIVGLGVGTGSVNEARVDGGLGTVVFMDLVVNIADGLAVGDVGSNVGANLGNSAHTSTTSFEDISSGSGRDGSSRESEDSGSSSDLGLSGDHDEYRMNEIKVRLKE